MGASVGRKPDIVREAWEMRFGLPPRSLFHEYLPIEWVLNQLSCCKSDEARRLILGIKPPEVEAASDSATARPPSQP